MEQVLLYVTAASRAEALAIARTLVREQRVACANVLGEITSVYRWQGAVEEGTEVGLILKTRRANVDGVVARVTALHGYECPCVIALPLVAGNPDFLEWIMKESSKEDDTN